MFMVISITSGRLKTHLLLKLHGHDSAENVLVAHCGTGRHVCSGALTAGGGGGEVSTWRLDLYFWTSLPAASTYTTRPSLWRPVLPMRCTFRPGLALAS